MLLRSVSFQTVSCFYRIIVYTVHCTMDLTIAIVSKCSVLRLRPALANATQRACGGAMTHWLIFIPRVNLQGQRVLSVYKPPGIVRARHAPGMPTNKLTISIYFLVTGSALFPSHYRKFLRVSRVTPSIFYLRHCGLPPFTRLVSTHEYFLVSFC